MARPAEVMDYDILRPLVLKVLNEDESKFGISTHDIASILAVQQTVPTSQFEAFKKDVSSVIRSLSIKKMILGKVYHDVKDDVDRTYFKINPDYSEEAEEQEENTQPEKAVSQAKDSDGSRMRVVGLVEISERESGRQANSATIHFSPIALGENVISIAIQQSGQKFYLPYIRGVHDFSITDCPEDLEVSDTIYEAEVLFLTLDAASIPQSIVNMLSEGLRQEIIAEQKRKTSNKLGLEIAIDIQKGEYIVLSVRQTRNPGI